MGARSGRSWHARAIGTTAFLALAGCRWWKVEPPALADAPAHDAAQDTAVDVPDPADGGFADAGDDDGSDRDVPLHTDGGLDAAARGYLIAAGGLHTCAVVPDGALYCWGANSYGTLGVADASGPDPQRVPLSGVVEIAASIRISPEGGHLIGCSLNPFVPPDASPVEGVLPPGYTCARTSGADAGVFCWGANEAAQVDHNSDASVIQHPTRRLPLLASEVVEISVGGAHACARTTMAVLRCWGDNRYRQASPEANSCHVRTPGAPMFDIASGPFLQVSAGGRHTCVLNDRRWVYCWGDNSRGQLGNTAVNDGDFEARVRAPIELGGAFLENVDQIAAGGEHTCAVVADAGVYCWGAADRRQLGVSADAGSVGEPVRVPGLVGRPVARLSAGAYHTCATLQSGEVYCWGSNTSGQSGATLGRPAVPSERVATLNGVRVLSAGGAHTCVLGGTTFSCWGRNAEGQLGRDTSGTAQSTPAAVEWP